MNKGTREPSGPFSGNFECAKKKKKKDYSTKTRPHLQPAPCLLWQEARARQPPAPPSRRKPEGKPGRPSPERMAGLVDFPFGFLGAGGRLPKARRGRVFIVKYYYYYYYYGHRRSARGGPNFEYANAGSRNPGPQGPYHQRSGQVVANSPSPDFAEELPLNKKKGGCMSAERPSFRTRGGPAVPGRVFDRGVSPLSLQRRSRRSSESRICFRKGWRTCSPSG